MKDHSPLKSTPLFPSDVYNKLPEILESCTKNFTDAREKDVVLTSSLVILSGCFSSCKGKYMNDWVAPNIYSFIVAPPASAKGSMKYSKLLGKTIQDNFLDANRKAREAYETDTKIWNKKVKSKSTSEEKPPIRPKYPVHYIPGNSSAASIYKLLDESNGRGTICETEADTLTGAIKQDWGGFSHLLRCAFQHETLSLSRSANETYISIEEPHLSTLLSGTPDQVPRLITSAEDGLSSRFLFYCYSRELEWINPLPCSDCSDLSEVFQELSVKVAEIKEKLDKHKIVFKLTELQFSTLTDNFKLKLNRVKSFEGDGAASAVYRLGLIAFRIAMIFTILRNKEVLDNGKVIECSDEDFNTTIKLIDVFFEHSMVMYSLLPKQTKRVVNPRIGRFYALLPKDVKFPRKTANLIGANIGLSEKSVGNYLTELKETGHIKSPNYGDYEIIETL